MDRLAGIDAKLDRADSLMDHVEVEWRTWSDAPGRWQFTADESQEKRRYIVKMRASEPLPPVFSLIASEVVHHARSSLDHLASHLVEVSGGDVTYATAWPVVRSREAWMERVEPEQPGRLGAALRRIFRPRPRPRVLAGASTEVRAFIETKQPYHGSGKVVDHPLFSLNDLWNVDKHRLVQMSPLYVLSPDDWRSVFTVRPDITPETFRWLISPDWRLEGAARLALFEFPIDQPHPALRIEGQLPTQIGVGVGEGVTVRLEESLRLVREIVSEARERFPRAVHQQA